MIASFDSMVERVFFENVVGVFLTGFSVSLLLPGILFFLVLVLFFRRPKALGIAYLFWHPNWKRQLTIGLGVGAVIWQTFLAGYLFEPLATNFTQDRPPFCEVQPTENYKSEIGDPFLRYDPLSIVTIFRYIGAVLCGATILGILALILAGLWKLLFHLGRRATPKKKKPKRPKNPLRTVWGFGLYFGTILGFAMMVGLSWALLQNDWGRHPLNSLGKSMTENAGWGKGAARADYLKDLNKGTNDGIPNAIDYYDKFADRYTKRQQPYFPIFGLFVVSSGLTLLLYVIWLVFPLLRQSFLPASGIMCLIQILLFLHVMIFYFIAAPHLILLATFLLMLGAGVRYKMKFPGLNYKTEKLVALQDHYGSEGASNGSSDLIQSESIPFHTPDETQQRPRQPLVIVSLSGGGSRATAWSMKMLTKLEEELKKKGIAFPYHVRLITGASGGMIAGAYYAAGLDKPGPNGEIRREEATPKVETGLPILPMLQKPRQQWTELDHLNNNVRQDCLTPIARTLLFPDLPSTVLPWGTSTDRGIALEEAWEVYLHGVMNRTFKELEEGEREGWRPSLICTPMTIEDGRQLFISNLDLGQETVNTANRLRGDGTGPSLLSREGNELFKLFPGAREHFKVATAARMSASFPFVMPAVEIPTDPPLRVVDAGYYDNYGVGIAATWLFNHLDWVKTNCSGVVLIQIRDGVTESVRLRQEPPPNADRQWWMRGIDWLTAPPVGLYNVRTSANGFHNDTLLHLVAELFNQSNDVSPEFFQTVELEFSGGDDVQLNFVLTREECKRIDDAAEEKSVRERIDALSTWWAARMSTT